MNDEELEEQSEAAILAHVELYRLTIAASVQRLFITRDKLPTEDDRIRTAEVLDSLVQRKLLVARQFPAAKGTLKGEPYYVLPAAKAVKAPGDSQTIDFDLQTLWFATLSEQRFYRLSVEETRKLFSRAPHHHVRHILGDVGDGPFVARIYPTKVGVKETLARLKQFMSEGRSKFDLGPWIDTGDYGFSILVDNHKKVESVADAVMSKRQGGGALADQVRIQVAFAPSASNISQAIGDL